MLTGKMLGFRGHVYLPVWGIQAMHTICHKPAHILGVNEILTLVTVLTTKGPIATIYQLIPRQQAMSKLGYMPYITNDTNMFDSINLGANLKVSDTSLRHKPIISNTNINNTCVRQSCN